MEANAAQTLFDVAPTRTATKLRIGGRPVDPGAWNLTARILAEWNAQTSRRWRLLKSSGEPSECAKRIYGRVLAYPDLTLAQHADIIRRTLASRWWGSGPASIGVVYGPNVFEDNIDRPGEAVVKDAELAARRARRRSARTALIDGSAA